MLFDENKKTFDKIFGLKEGIKEIRGTIFEFRNKIMRSIDQSLTFQKSENGSNKLGQSLSKIKFEINGFEKVLHQFSQTMTTLDLSLSKIQILMESKDLPQFDNFRTDFDNAKNHLDTESYDMKQFRSEGDKRSEEMIGNLKKLYDKFIDGIEKQKLTEELILMSRNNPDFGNLSVTQIDFETKKKYGEELSF
jgi:hypothetical protein